MEQTPALNEARRDDSLTNADDVASKVPRPHSLSSNSGVCETSLYRAPLLVY
jgi:hypothetical protein